MGRLDSAGRSQARAMIWHTCAGVNFAGAPGLGASAIRLAALTSSSGTARNCSQRLRQWPGVSSSTPSFRAICKLFKPSPAANTIRARKASCWPVVKARTKRSNSARSRSLNTTLGGLGVAIAHSGQIKMLDLTRHSTNSRLLSAHLY
jgi:hypothetical protein